MGKLKKLSALVLSLAMALALAACGGTSQNETTGTSQASDASDTTTSEQTTEIESTDESSASEETTEEATGETIRIGHIVDLSGTEATTGEAASQALQFALDEIGGQIAGHPVEIVVLDAQGTTDGATTAAQSLVEQYGCVAIFGPTQAGQKAAVAAYCNDAGVPMFCYNGSPISTFTDDGYVIGVGGANPQLTVMADYCYNTLGYRNVTLMTHDNTGFRTFTDDFATCFKGMGGSVASEFYAPSSTSDWTSYFAAMDTSSDAIMAWSTGSTAIAFWRDWYYSNTGVPVTGIMDSAFVVDFVLKALDAISTDITDAILGTYAPTMYSYTIDTPENEEFVNAWYEEFSEYPTNNITGQCAQAMLLFKETLENIDGDITHQSIIDTVFDMEIDGPCGHLAFADSHAATKDVYITQVVRLENGQYALDVVYTYENVAPEGILTQYQ